MSFTIGKLFHIIHMSDAVWDRMNRGGRPDGDRRCGARGAAEQRRGVRGADHAVGGITERGRLLSGVFVVSYRHPLQTAKAFATLDSLSGGRAILGVGARHVEAEFAVLGVPFNQRGRLTNEGVTTIRAALAANGA